MKITAENINLPRLITVPMAAEHLGVCRRTVDRLIAAQKIHVCKVGRSSRIAVSELVRYVALSQGSPSGSGSAT